MKSWIVFVLGLFLGSIISSSWWVAAKWGYGKDLESLWAIPIIMTIFTLVGLGAWLYDAFDNED